MEVKHRDDIANLKDGQRAFEIEGGDVIVVEITQRAVEENPHNITSEHHVAVQVRAWKVNPDGTVAIDSRGKELEIPKRVESIVTSALAEGTVDLDNQLVDYSLAALVRAKNWLHVKAAMEKIPLSS
ncbi:MAG: hypothetical protein JWO13_2292 [Acidobacteriales bacterium]|nr:hypothetical protein [Terriglobales bacterium]